MYLRGLKGFGRLVEDAAGNVYDDGTPDTSNTDVYSTTDAGSEYGVQGSLPTPSSQPPTSNSNWTGLVQAALTTWGNYNVAKVQTSGEVAKAQAQAQSARYLVPAAYQRPVVASGGFSLGGVGPLLTLAAIGGVLYAVMK